MSNYILRCDNLSCVRGGRELFHNLNFTVNSGSMVLISGDNGSGKTSLLEILAGIVSSSSGAVTLENVVDIDKNCHSPFIAYIGHKNACSDSLSVFENIEFWAAVRDSRELILPTIYYFQLQNVLNLKYYQLSAGWKRRVALSRLMIFNASIWLIDEPFINLDDNSCALIKSLIVTRLENNGIVIITNHGQNIDFAKYNLVEIAKFK